MNKEQISLDNDIAVIQQLIQSAEKYQNDIDSFMPLHTNDVIIVNIAGRRVMGKDSFYQAMKQALDSPLEKVLTKIDINDIRFISSDIAIVSCIKQVSDQRNILPGNPADKLPSTGSLSYVVVKNQNKWQIALAQTTPIKQ